MIERLGEVIRAGAPLAQNSADHLFKWMEGVGFSAELPLPCRAFWAVQDGAVVVRAGVEWRLYASLEIPLIYSDYRLAQYLPGALPVATDCAGALFALDLRESGAAPVVRVSAGDLGWDSAERIADSFDGFLNWIASQE